jgi:hypothetical protein
MHVKQCCRKGIAVDVCFLKYHKWIKYVDVDVSYVE